MKELRLQPSGIPPSVAFGGGDSQSSIDANEVMLVEYEKRLVKLKEKLQSRTAELTTQILETETEIAAIKAALKQLKN